MFLHTPTFPWTCDNRWPTSNADVIAVLDLGMISIPTPVTHCYWRLVTTPRPAARRSGTYARLGLSTLEERRTASLALAGAAVFRRPPCAARQHRGPPMVCFSCVRPANPSADPAVPIWVRHMDLLLRGRSSAKPRMHGSFWADSSRRRKFVPLRAQVPLIPLSAEPSPAASPVRGSQSPYKRPRRGPPPRIVLGLASPHSVTHPR